MLAVLSNVILGLALAWANGANDVAKGVATLVGSGAAHTRRAIAWGALWTTLGDLAVTLPVAATLSALSLFPARSFS